jgi:hypothetical protein
VFIHFNTLLAQPLPRLPELLLHQSKPIQKLGLDSLRKSLGDVHEGSQLGEDVVDLGFGGVFGEFVWGAADAPSQR